MKFRTYLIVFITAFTGAFFLASCLNEENKIPPNCYDGILNNGENPQGYTDNSSGTPVPMVDCGGPCEPCDHCHNGIYEPWEDEDWKDCGGECGPCASCSNGIKDGDEQGIDCGGSCGGCELLCGNGLLDGFEDQVDCENEEDLIQGGCDFCPTCVDGMMNGNETGIDCGGTDCSPCCTTGSCLNGVMDGDEFDVNCGGSTCPGCADTLVWKIGSVTYYTPSINIVASQAIGLEFNTCGAFEVGEAPIPQGTLSIKITVPSNGWLPWIGSAMEFPDPLLITDYSIEFIDNQGNVFSSSNPGGSGTIVMGRVASTVVPPSTTDGCNKPGGTYNYYRGTFKGTLTTALGTALPISCTNGVFKKTFFTP